MHLGVFCSAPSEWAACLSLERVQLFFFSPFPFSSRNEISSALSVLPMPSPVGCRALVAAGGGVVDLHCVPWGTNMGLACGLTSSALLAGSSVL